MIKYVSSALCLFFLLVWTQSNDYWLLVASLAWLVIYMFAEEITAYGKVNK